MDGKTSSQSFNWQEILNTSGKLLKQVLRGLVLILKWLKKKIVQGLGRFRKKRKPMTILSHWHQLIEGLEESPQQIYAQMEKTVKSRKLPDTVISRMTYPEAGVLSSEREYLRIQRKEHIFDICAAPFGTGFFVSWWLGQTRRFSWLLAVIFVIVLEIIGLLIKLPWEWPIGIGVVIVLLWRLSVRPTYYRLDTAMMFRDSVHTAVMEVVDQVINTKGLRELTDEEKKPILHDIFRR